MKLFFKGIMYEGRHEAETGMLLVVNIASGRPATAFRVHNEEDIVSAWMEFAKDPGAFLQNRRQRARRIYRRKTERGRR